MANAVEKVNTIAIASIEAINTITDANLEALNTLEFTGVAPDAHTLISTHTASSSSSLDITSGITSTYDVYEFVFTNMHPATTDDTFGFQVNAATGSNTSGFNQYITSTAFEAYHREDNSGTPNIGYLTGSDQAQTQLYQILTVGVSADTDSGASGVLTLYAPSSTTYVKHFIARSQAMAEANDPGTSVENDIAGYINAEEAMDEISFKFSSGNIDAGVIKMYGIAKS
jgi:hypothetical protein